MNAIDFSQTEHHCIYVAKRESSEHITLTSMRAAKIEYESSTITPQFYSLVCEFVACYNQLGYRWLQAECFWLQIVRPPSESAIPSFSCHPNLIDRNRSHKLSNYNWLRSHVQCKLSDRRASHLHRLCAAAAYSRKGRTLFGVLGDAA